MNKKSWHAICAVAIVILSGCGGLSVDKIREQETTYQAKQAELEAKMNAKGRIVYATKDIPEGSVVRADALEEREIEQSKIPQDAMTSASLVVGRKVKYEIGAGQIIGQHDLILVHHK